MKTIGGMAGADLGGPKGPRPSLLLNKMFDRKCKNVQNSNKIASNSLQMLEIVFRMIQNSTFSGGTCPGKDRHRRPIGLPTLRPLLSKIPGSAPEWSFERATISVSSFSLIIVSYNFATILLLCLWFFILSLKHIWYFLFILMMKQDCCFKWRSYLFYQV